MSNRKVVAAKEAAYKAYCVESDRCERIMRRAATFGRLSEVNVAIEWNRSRDIGYADAMLAKVSEKLIKIANAPRPNLFTRDGKQRAACTLAALSGVTVATARRYLENNVRSLYGRSILGRAAYTLGWDDLATRPLRLIER